MGNWRRRAFTVAMFAVLRTVTSFPGGIPGVALILLRAHAAAIALAGPFQLLPIWLAPFVLVATAGALLGFFSRVSALSLTAALAGAGIGYSIAADAIFCGDLLALASFALAGPGAYSIDACLHGRRRIRVPTRPHA